MGVLSLSTRPILFLILAAVSCSTARSEEQAKWEFNTERSGWTPNGQTELKVADGVLTITSKGADPYISAPASAPAGWHLLTIDAQFEGTAATQLFWTTQKDNGTSEANSVRSQFTGNPGAFRPLQLFFHTDSPLTSLRIDPLTAPGQMAVRSITLSARQPPAPEATPVEDIRVPANFRVERLHSVRAEQHGSWVSMTKDDAGRLIVSDQYGKLHRITPPALGKSTPVKIETIAVEVGMAQGLLYAFDSLYVMVNGNNNDKQGLYRVRDTNGDDEYDSVEHLRKIDGGGEHGPHAVILAPDGKSLYVCAGNHTNPTDFSASRVPRNWQEDQLLPRMWDAGGHAVGKMAPGGWIAKVSPDGKDWELVASGFRNEYDIAFNPEGELFTYDADMEWDVGTPWYRPTRVNHVTSGAEFGWRSGTGKWPTWYPDSLPEVVDIGPGSPTGITFGTGSAFPRKYQRALFISDWSYGVIYAVHLKPQGASWLGEAEPFISAAPLPVTDLVVGSDGALYFTIGGRRTQSGLYRVTYHGKESIAAESQRIAEGSDLRKLRRQLEELHTDNAEDAVVEAWPYLGHADRHIRYAARIAIEHRPVAEWAEKALAESTNVDSRITALLALARNADRAYQVSLLRALGGLAGQEMTDEQSLAALRVIQLAFIRMGEPDPEVNVAVSAILGPFYPTESTRLNRELCALLVYLNHPDVAEETVKLMKTAPTQEEQMYYALCLRALKDNWTVETRREYFQWFLDAAGMRGGYSFGGFLANIRKDAIATLSESEQESLQEILEKTPTAATPEIEAQSRPFVKKWAVADLISDVAGRMKERDFGNGKKMFTVTGCYKCHRFAGSGGIVGPDLTAVGRRFNDQNMLESLIEPSKVVSDQYEATMFLTASGKQVVGRVVNLNGDTLMVSENMLDPGRLTNIKRDDIEEMMVSKKSMMPDGLLNNLSREEILDLVAYLQSGGNPESDIFERK